MTCTEAGESITCPITTDVVEEADLQSIDLADFVSGLSAPGVSDSSTLVIQASGGAGTGSQSGEGTAADSGVAQTVTTVSEFNNRYDTTEMYVYLGQQGDTADVANGKKSGGGGSATILATVDGDSEAFDVDSNVVLVAGGSGAGGTGNYDTSNQGHGGAGGSAISTEPGDGNCSGLGDPVCGSGDDGTGGDQHAKHADVGYGGGDGKGGDGYSVNGGDGAGGQGGAPYDGSYTGWAGGYEPSEVVSDKQGRGGPGYQDKGDHCVYTDRDNAGWGGGGGGGYGGGGNGGAAEDCPSAGDDMVSLGAGGGGGGSFAVGSTAVAQHMSPDPSTADGEVTLIFEGVETCAPSC